MAKTLVVPDFSGKTILIAEDEEASYLFLSEEIAATGAKLIWTKSGVQAVKLCKNNPRIDLVLMDIKLLDSDGYTATQKIKTVRKDLPVIAQTSFVLVGQKELLFQAGCDNYLKKPVNTSELYTMLKRYLNKCNN